MCRESYLCGMNKRRVTGYGLRVAVAGYGCILCRRSLPASCFFLLLPGCVQSDVILRCAAFLALSFIAAMSGTDPRGAVWSAPGAREEPLCALDVHETGFRNDAGTAGTMVFASPQGWPENVGKTIVHGGSPITSHQADLTFHVPAGRYSVVVLHDENSNMRLDRNVFGIPKEGFGFSNNPRVLFSAPSFQSAEIPITCPKTAVQIRLIYK